MEGAEPDTEGRGLWDPTYTKSPGEANSQRQKWTVGPGLQEGRERGFHGDRASTWEDGPSWRARWWRLHSSVTVPDAAGLCPETQ